MLLIQLHLQNTMKIALEEQFTNTDFDSWSNEDWTNETNRGV